LVTCTDCSVPGLQQYINGSWQPLGQSESTSIGNYGTVTNPATGKVWLDRNLGATKVATSLTDAASYGHLFQWGRNADGHEVRTSGTTQYLAQDFFTQNGLFIRNTSPFNWLANDQIHMWSGTAAENNPCPCGFRIPTAAEWEQERRTWIFNNAAGAFSSPLKLPNAGYRAWGGSIFGVGTEGDYASSSGFNGEARYLEILSNNASMSTLPRSVGFSVRCIKD
jgi:hypothetical protein